MHTKKNASFILIVALSMLILAYITYATVYEQILSKSNGFFNVILFGVVLILVFIFITLLARVITINPDKTEVSPVLKILVLLGIIAIFAVFTWLRLQYTSSVSPSESFSFRASEYLAENRLAQGSEIHKHLIDYPADFTYALFVSKIFGIIDSSAATYTIINISMMLLAALFLFLTINTVSAKVSAVVGIIAFMFMPNNAFLVYSYNSELFVAAVFLITLFLYITLIYVRFKSSFAPVLIAVLCGIFSGICISSEPVLIIVFIALSIWVGAAERQSAICIALPHIISVCITGLICVHKSLLIGCSFIDVLLGLGLCFVPSNMRDGTSGEFGFSGLFQALNGRVNDPSHFLNDNFYFLTNITGKSFSANQAIWLDIADQISYIFMLVLCVLCVVYILRITYERVVPLLSVMVLLFFGQILGGMNRVNTVYFISAIIIVGSSTLYYMYLNHHFDYAVYVTNAQIEKDNKIKKAAMGADIDDDFSGEEDSDRGPVDENYIMRARALIFLGENDDLYNEIKRQERSSRLSDSVAATRIRTSVNEEGEYDSVVEHVEYFDELDEVKEVKNNKPATGVTAIPSTRPVEVVKPILADEYFDEVLSPSPGLKPETEAPAWQTKAPAEISQPKTDAVVTATLQEPVETGFVFRNKNKDNDITDNKSNSLSKRNKNDSVIKESKKDLKKDKKLEKKTEKKTLKTLGKNKTSIQENGTDLKNIKAGEPLPNPLPTPKKHVARDLDFDIDVSSNDDYDV